MPSAIAALANAVQPWQSLYAGHSSVSTLVLFIHISALVGSAGLAVANDRAIVRTSKEDITGHARRLADLSLSHRSVVTALAVSLISGVLLLLADVEAFLRMPAFWIKMGLILLLVGNASLMLRRETQLRRIESALVPVAPAINGRLWLALRRHALASLALWFAIVLAGTALASN
ncbi:MAG: hypothetical protein ABI852_07830 [Gemmatimonadaceae bacterium]